MKRVFAIVLATIMCLSLVGCIVSGISGELSRMSVEERAEYLKENCNSYDCNELIRYPNKYKDTLVVVSGEVIAVHSPNLSSSVFIGGESKIYVDMIVGGNSIRVNYDEFYDDLRLFKGDKVTIYGVYSECSDVPIIDCYYAELNNKYD